MKSFEKDGIVYTCHGQTPDLYEELFGDDCDLLSDIAAVTKDIAKLAKQNGDIDINNFKDVEKMSEKEMLKVIETAEQMHIRIPSRNKMRQIIVCCIAQTLKDEGQDFSVGDILKTLNAGVFLDYVLFTQISELVFGKKKENATVRKSRIIYR